MPIHTPYSPVAAAGLSKRGSSFFFFF